MKKSLLLILLITFFHNAAFASTCSMQFSHVAQKVNDCVYFSSEKNCDQFVDQFATLNQLYEVMMIFLFNKNSLANQPVLVQVQDLQGREIEDYIKDNFDDDILESSLQLRLSKREKRRIKISSYKNFIRSINNQYKKYFMRYLKILSKEIPWEELQNLKEGLTFDEIITTTSLLDEYHCNALIYRNRYRINVDQLAAEVLNTYFRDKVGSLHISSINYSSSFLSHINDELKTLLDSDYGVITQYDDRTIRKYRGMYLLDYFSVRSIVLNNYKFTVIINRNPDRSCLVLNHRPGCVPYGRIVLVEKKNNLIWSKTNEICTEKTKTYQDWSNQCTHVIKQIASGLF